MYKRALPGLQSPLIVSSLGKILSDPDVGSLALVYIKIIGLKPGGATVGVCANKYNRLRYLQTIYML